MISPRALFGVAVRVLGIWFFTEAGYSAFWYVLRDRVAMGNSNIPNSGHLAFACYYVLVGVALILLADPITWAIYGEPLKTREALNVPLGDATQDEVAERIAVYRSSENSG